MPDEQERSQSGDPIYRYPPRQGGFEPSRSENPADREKIELHIEQYWGKVDQVYHEIVSELVHLDIYVVAPTDSKPYYTLITGGMSDLPMIVPAGFENRRYAELLICLPPNWPLFDKNFQKEENYWPIRWLKIMGRFPHEYNTWLGWGHTLPNGEPAEPFASNTGLCGLLVIPPILTSYEHTKLIINPDKTINFYSLVPLYTEEMDFKLRYGSDKLLDQFDKFKINELLNPQRQNSCI